MSDLGEQIRRAAERASREQQADAFEDRIVRRLLRSAGLLGNLSELRRRVREEYGLDALTFEWFHSEYPSFPVRLFAQKMRYTHLVKLGDLYGKKRFQSLPWWKEYIEATATADIDLFEERAGLVFNLPGAREASLMVLHNHPPRGMLLADPEDREDDPWPRTLFPMGPARRRIMMVLEPFPGFLRTVGPWGAGCGQE